jgi:hypothetical protein
MKPNTDKIDDAVLALLHLTSFTEGKGELAFTRAQSDPKAFADMQSYRRA